MTMQTARLRVRSVRYKDGRSVVRLRAPADPDRAYIEERVRGVLDAHDHDFCGFAFVVWGSDARSTTFASTNDGSRIPVALIPDFVRNILLADRIEAWTIERLDKRHS
jgi:hypothetical protein